jgi:hypothetical protein
MVTDQQKTAAHPGRERSHHRLCHTKRKSIPAPIASQAPRLGEKKRRKAMLKPAMAAIKRPLTLELNKAKDIKSINRATKVTLMPVPGLKIVGRLINGLGDLRK